MKRLREGKDKGATKSYSNALKSLIHVLKNLYLAKLGLKESLSLDEARDNDEVKAQVEAIVDSIDGTVPVYDRTVISCVSQEQHAIHVYH